MEEDGPVYSRSLNQTPVLGLTDALNTGWTLVVVVLEVDLNTPR